jgi:hypothetical protein
MAERIVIQLQHANSAVVLTTIKVLLYLMNYMENRKLMDYICKKMGPPLGDYFSLIRRAYTDRPSYSDVVIIGTGGTVCCTTEHSFDYPTPATCSQKRRESLLLQV